MWRPCAPLTSNDLAAFVEADLAFHDLILRASENVFAAVLFEPLHRVLEKRRTETSKVPDIQEHAIGHHQQLPTPWSHAIRTAPATPWTPTCSRRWTTSRATSSRFVPARVRSEAAAV